MDRLRRDTNDKRSDKHRSMTQSEKDEKVREMQAASLALQDQRKDRSGYTAANATPSEADQKLKESKQGGAHFISKVRQEVYMDSDMNLEERMNR